MNPDKQPMAETPFTFLIGATGFVGMAVARVAEKFAVAITPAMQSLIDPADPFDPIAAQFVPSEQELNILPEERADPIGVGNQWSVEDYKGQLHAYSDCLNSDA